MATDHREKFALFLRIIECDNPDLSDTDVVTSYSVQGVEVSLTVGDFRKMVSQIEVEK